MPHPAGDHKGRPYIGTGAIRMVLRPRRQPQSPRSLGGSTVSSARKKAITKGLRQISGALCPNMEARGPGARRPLVVFVYSRLANKGSLAGVNAAKRLRVREAAFGSKSGLSGIPHSNEAIRKAKRGRAFVRMKNDHPFKDLMRPDEDIGPYGPNAGWRVEFLFLLLFSRNLGGPELTGLVRPACLAGLDPGLHAVAAVDLVVSLFSTEVVLLVIDAGTADLLPGVKLLENHVLSPQKEYITDFENLLKLHPKRFKIITKSIGRGTKE